MDLSTLIEQIKSLSLTPNETFQVINELLFEDDKLFAHFLNEEDKYHTLIWVQDTAKVCHKFMEHRPLPDVDEEDEQELVALCRKHDELRVELQQFSSTHEQLLGQRKALEASYLQWKELKQDVQKLKEMQREASKENIVALQLKTDDIKQQLGDAHDRLRALQQLDAELCSELEQVNARCQEMEDGLKPELERLAENSAHLTEQLKREWNAIDHELHLQRKQLAQWKKHYQTITSELDSCLNELEQVTSATQANQELYTRHFETNQNATSALSNVVDQTNFNDLRQRSKQIADDLQQFDRLLRHTLSMQEDIQRNTRRLNGFSPE